MAISSAVDPSVVARTIGIKENFKNLAAGNARFLPQRVAVIGQGNTASNATYETTKKRVFTALEVGETYGYGSPLHLAVLQLLPLNGDGVGTIPVTVYPLKDEVAAVAAAGSITPVVGTVAADTNFKVRIGGVDSEAFTVTTTDAVADVIASMITAINAVPEMPVTAADGTTKLDLTAKWKGASGNGVTIQVLGSTTAGMTWTIGAMASGATNPDVDTALNQIGDVWETAIINCMESTDTGTLNKIKTVGDGRWLATVMKPFVSFVGDTEATVATSYAVPDARGTDRINCQLVAPGSKDLPFVVAAREAARIVKQANNNPAVDYSRWYATGLTPGLDSEQWTHTQRDAAVKAGCSTIEVVDGVIKLSDTVTMYHPTGDPLPAYRYVVDVMKLMTVMYNTWLIFNDPSWAGAPLIPDDQPTTNPAAKKPKMAVAAIAGMIDSLANEAILSDPETAKATIVAGISSTNPKRLDVAFTVQLSGNTQVISVDLNWGFYFGAVPAVA